MKQLTMTKVLTPLAALAFAFGVQAAIVSDGFETDTSTVVTNLTGWSFVCGTDGADDASAITAYGAATKPSSYSEAFASAGDKYLKLSTEDGTLFRNLSDETASRTVGTAGLFVDTDVQFTVTDASDSPTNTVDSSDKLVIWLEANGATTNLCVLGHGFGSSTSARTDKVYTLVPAAGGTLSITPGAWYRLTVKAVSGFSLDGETVSYPAFQVYLDGVALKASEYIATQAGFSPAIQDITAYQPYIPARTDSMTFLYKVGFSGEGALDNIAIAEDIPEFLPRQKMSVNWDTTVISAVTFHTGATTTTLTAPGDVNVDANTAITFSTTDISFVSGNSNDYDFTDPENWTKSGDTALSLSGNTVTSAAGDIDGAFTIAVAANNNCVLTLTATGTEDFIGDLATVSYVITRGGDAGDPVALDEYGKDALLDGYAINCLIGDVITFTVVPASGKTATLTALNGGTFSGNAFTVSAGAHTAGVRITVASAKATIDGVGYTSFADAFNAAKAAGTAKTIVLADNATSVAATVENGNEITIDLAGNTITGADGSAVFTVAAGGTLTITNSIDTGYVIASAAEGSACISNSGTLNLQAGKFNGTISGGTINVTGGFYTANIVGAIPAPDMKLAETVQEDTYVWTLVAKVYYTAISLDQATLALTVGDTTNLVATLTPSSAADDSVTWASSAPAVATVANGTVTALAAGTATITLTATHDTTVKATCTVTVTAAGPEIPDITPSADGESAQSYTEADATTITNAINNAKSEYIKAPAGVTGKAAEDYSEMFEAKVVSDGTDGYKVVVELTETAAAAVQDEADSNAAEVIEDLSASDVELTTKPGLYYSFEYGTTLEGMTEGARTLATGTSLTLPRPTTSNATAGFYKVLVNTAPKAAD